MRRDTIPDFQQQHQYPAEEGPYIVSSPETQQQQQQFSAQTRDSGLARGSTNSYKYKVQHDSISIDGRLIKKGRYGNRESYRPLSVGSRFPVKPRSPVQVAPHEPGYIV